MKKVPLEKSQKPLKRTPLKKQNLNSAKIKQEERAVTRLEDSIFYNEIWTKRSQKSDLTGNWLGNQLLTSYFHHLLPKSLYPQYRHKKWNILLCEDFYHNQIEIKETGLPKEIYDKFINILNQAKKKAGLLI